MIAVCGLMGQGLFVFRGIRLVREVRLPAGQRDTPWRIPARAPTGSPVRSGMPDAMARNPSFFWFVSSRRLLQDTRHVTATHCPKTDTTDHFSHLSNHPKNSRCHKMLFCGCSTQWFSSGKKSKRLGTPCKRAALNACNPSAYGTR